MTNYTKTTDFAAKDSLPSGDSGKIIRGAEFGTEFDNIETAVNSKSNKENPVFTGTITGNGSGITNVAAASIDLTVSSDTDADYNVPFMNATGDGGSAKVLQVDDNGLMFNPNSNTLSVNRLKGSNDNLLIQDTSGNTILDIDANALEIPVNTTITGTTAVTGNVTVTGTVEFDGLSGTGAVTVTDILDQDNMSSNSATALATQQSIKSYVDSQVATSDTLAEVLANGNTTGGTAISLASSDILGTGNINITGAVTADGLTIDGSSSGVLNNVNFLNTNSSNTATANRIGLGITNSVGPVYTYIEANEDVTDGRPSLNFYTGDTATKRLRITDGGDVEFYEDGGATAKLTWDASDENLEFADNSKAVFGAGSDLQIYHDGSDSRITDAGTGYLAIDTNGSDIRLTSNSFAEYMAKFEQDGAATLYHNGSAKIATTSTGIDVTGFVNTDGIIHTGDTDTFIKFADNRIYQEIGGYRVLDFETSSSKLNSNDSVFIQTGTTTKNRIKVNQGGDIGFYNSAGTNQSLVWDASTERLGIGNAAPTTALDVSGTVTADGLTVQTAQGDITIPTSTSSLNFARAGANYIRATDAAGSFHFVTGANDFATTRLRISANGDVALFEDTGTTAKFFWDASAESLGIGRSNNIRDKLTVSTADTGTTFGPTTAAIDITNQDASGFGAYAGVNFRVGGGSYNESIAAVQAEYTAYSGNVMGELVFGTRKASTTDVTEAMRIDQNGNVGIGTDSPSSALEVAGSAVELSITDSRDSSFTTGDTVASLGFYSDDTSGGSGTTPTLARGAIDVVSENTFGSSHGMVFRTRGDVTTAAAEVMRISSVGRVGIGNDSPSALLTVGSTTDTAGVVMSVDNGGYSTKIEHDADKAMIYGNSAFRALAFGTNNTEAMRIDSSQNVLVGGTSTTPWSNGTGTASDNQLVAREDGVIGASSHKATANAGYVGYFNRTSTDGGILAFNKNGSTVGSIGTAGSRVYISGPSASLHSGLIFTDNGSHGIIAPSTNAGAIANGTMDLGYGSGRFKDGHFSGNINANTFTAIDGVYIGGTGFANKLDDYEEGTWTPATGAGNLSGTGLAYEGRYTKIGNTVICHLRITTTGADLQVTSYQLFTGLPFSVSKAGTGTVITEDIDQFSRQGFASILGSSFAISKCGSATGTTFVDAMVVYMTS